MGDVGLSYVLVDLGFKSLDVDGDGGLGVVYLEGLLAFLPLCRDLTLDLAL